MSGMACVVVQDLHGMDPFNCQRATRRDWKRGQRFLSMEFHQCRGSDTQYELQTLSTFQQCKTAPPVKVVCVVNRFDIQIDRKGEERGNGCIGFPHLPMSCDLGWCHSCYQKGGLKRRKGGCWWVRGWMERILNACLHFMVFIIAVWLFSSLKYSGTGGFLAEVPVVDPKLVGCLERCVRECRVLRCPWARYRTPKCYGWYFIHSDTSPTMIDSNFHIWDWCRMLLLFLLEILPNFQQKWWREFSHPFKI